MRIAVFGGAGYIGSHAACALLERSHEVVIADNLSKGSYEVVARLRAITGRTPGFASIDVRHARPLATFLCNQRFDAILHFAAFKSVSESCRQPLEYFHNNVAGSINLFMAMREAGCRRIVFSSSATVYGEPERVPIDEACALRVTNPYGRSKLAVEAMIEDACRADRGLTGVCLRYFNPVGAHPSGLLGESPDGIPDNLMPYICQVAAGQRPFLDIFGGDWPTRDGTGVRDYIHVMDLVEAHVEALEQVPAGRGYVPLNLGTGRGISVLELVHAFERANGVEVPHRIVARREGDIAEAFADPTRAQRELGWHARRGLETMCRDAWNWVRRNPLGYRALPVGEPPHAAAHGRAREEPSAVIDAEHSPRN